MRRLVVMVLAGVLVGVWAHTAPIAGATGVTVKVDVAAAVPSGAESCVGVIYPTCTTPYAGPGVSVGGTRVWELAFTISTFRPCSFPFVTGTWTLVAGDESGDGLSGRLSGPIGGPLQMEVTAGTGAYAGSVDAVPGGAQQNFQTVGAPGSPFTCTMAVVPAYAGQLEFALQSASA